MIEVNLNIVLSILGALFLILSYIIGYFLKNVHKGYESTKAVMSEIKTDVAVIKSGLKTQQTQISEVFRKFDKNK